MSLTLRVLLNRGTLRRCSGPSLAAGDLPGLYAPWLSPLSFFFFQVSDSPAFFIACLDQQLLTDSLSVMHPFWVSLWRPPMCFANEMEWIQENERARWRGARSISSTILEWELKLYNEAIFSFRNAISLSLDGLRKRATTEYKVGEITKIVDARFTCIPEHAVNSKMSLKWSPGVLLHWKID